MASDAFSGQKIAESAIKNNDLEIAIITENTDYPAALSRVFTENYTKLGGTVVIEEKFNTTDNDFKTIISKVLAKNPDAIYLNPQTPKTFTILLKQLRDMGYNGRLYGNEYTRSKEVLEGYSSEIEGIIFAEAKFDETDPDTAELLEKLKANNIDVSFPSYQTKVYDSVYIIKDALVVCGEDTDCIKNQLYSIKNRKGTDGYLAINKDGDAELTFELKSVQNGQIVLYNN